MSTQKTQTTKDKDVDVEQELQHVLSKIKNKCSRHTQGSHITADNNALLTLKTEQNKLYDGFQSRPDMQIGLTFANVLRESELDSNMYRVLWKPGTQSDAVLVETRPFDRGREYQEVL